MDALVDQKVVVVIPNWNGRDQLAGCLDSVLAQSTPCHIIVVDNGSVDGSVELIETSYQSVELIRHSRNLGYAGGVNPGFKRAIELGADYVAPFNNDAVADKDWLLQLVKYVDSHAEVGIAACKVASADGKHLDSTGDYYTTWGLAFPRGRNEADTHQYDDQTNIFGASGAASLYRVSMLREVGLLDEDFFAYYEDVDLSFRAQLAGWKVAYVAASVVYHEQGTTSRRMFGFSTYQTLKNYPWLFVKNVPSRLIFHIGPRFMLAYAAFIFKATIEGRGWYALKGMMQSLRLLPKKLVQRHHIQSQRLVSAEYIWNLIVHDLPPLSPDLRRLRSTWWKLTGKKAS